MVTSMPEMARPASTVSMGIRAVLLLLASVIVILIGQGGRELLPPDDLREAEVAREMYVGDDYIVPHLAGLPFVEKPSGFPAVVATAYRIAGGPSVAAARLTVVVFALATLTPVFLLGWRILGIEGGSLATALLALSQRFCRTAHEVLLDNALTAAIAFTILFSWIAIEADTPPRKRITYAAAAFSLGVSFLFKGFVGPTLFGSGFLLYLVLSRRFSELRYILRPAPVIAFLIPVLFWVIPFLLRAPSDLVQEFFVGNHFGRMVFGYNSHSRPFYFYLANIWPDFAPASILLPLAIWIAWKRRREWESRAGIFFLALSIGPLIPLSVSVAKDSVYFLPLHPVLAMLIAWTVVKGWRSVGRGARIFTRGMAAAVMLVAASAVVRTGILGGTALSVAAATVVFLFATSGCVFSIRRDDLPWTSACVAVLVALAWSLWFTGPLARAEVAKRDMHPFIVEVLSRAGDRDILLYRPTDGLRGAASFYRNRTAQEITSLPELVSRLAENPDKTVALIRSFDEETLPPQMEKVRQAAGVDLRVEARFHYRRKHILLVSAGPTSLDMEAERN